MSQNPIVLPTTGVFSGATEQGYLNAALDTLNTKFSGATAPSSPEQGQYWLNSNVSSLQPLNVFDSVNWLNTGAIDVTNSIWTPPIGGGIIPTITAAATTNLGSKPQGRKYVTGSTGITNLGTSAVIGTLHFVKFLSSVTITAGAAILTLTGSNMSVNANDETIWSYESANVWRLLYWSAGSALPSIANNTVLANISGSSAAPSGQTMSTLMDILGATNGTLPYRSGGTWVNTTVTAILDAAIGATVGGVMVRGVSAWGATIPNTAGFVLTDNGVGAVPTMQASSASSYGGASTTSNSSNLILTNSSNRLQYVTMTAAGLTAQLPDATTLATAGSNIFQIKNTGTFSFTITDLAGKPVAIVGAGEQFMLACSSISTSSGNWSAGNMNPGAFMPQLVNTNNAKAITVPATNTAGVASMTYIPLTSTTFLSVWIDQATTNTVKAAVVTMSGETLTVGSTVLIETDANLLSLNGCALTSTAGLIVYSTTGTMKAMVISVSGTTPSPNTSVSVQAVATAFPYIYQLSSSAAFLGYLTTGNATEGLVLSVSGTTITVNTRVAGGSVGNSANGFHISQLGVNTYMYVGITGSTPYSLNAQILTVSGTSVSFGSINSALTQVISTTAPNSLIVTPLSPTLAIFFVNSTPGSYGLISISGAVVGLVGTVIINSDFTGATFFSIINPNNTWISLFYSNASTYFSCRMLKVDVPNQSVIYGPQYLYNNLVSASSLAVNPGRYVNGQYGCAFGGAIASNYEYSNNTQLINAVY